ncbi:hypothetical protein E1263_13165 [Kribbella antibiotica]|uniref:SAF domain-containing protein n=1 Tax=Kribbella antibiotica TaxID=190195 RepID=A0A4R4ZM20_9ACTN|nr:hypothetical protein [Kribbella antibiotica]TDD59878.1 hypothetical protein E1263_13165 [Kribbella antibiotica]
MSLSSSTRSPAPNARGKGRPVGGGTNRLPSNRERRPALAALAVILILLGAAGSALIAVTSGNRDAYVVIKVKELPPGHQIVENDLDSGDLAGETGGLVKWADRKQVIDKYTTGWLYKGQYVGGDSVNATVPIPAGGAQVGVVLEAGRAPSDGIDPGDIVSVVRVPTGSQDSVAASTIVSAAYVMSSDGDIVPQPGTKVTVDKLNVTILVPLGKATTVAAAASAKTLVLVKLAPGTKPDVPRSNGGG